MFVSVLDSDNILQAYAILYRIAGKFQGSGVHLYCVSISQVKILWMCRNFCRFCSTRSLIFVAKIHLQVFIFIDNLDPMQAPPIYTHLGTTYRLRCIHLVYWSVAWLSYIANLYRLIICHVYTCTKRSCSSPQPKITRPHPKQQQHGDKQRRGSRGASALRQEGSEAVWNELSHFRSRCQELEKQT